MNLSKIDEMALEPSFQLYLSHRFCPPDSLLFSRTRSQIVESHIQKCPSCQERLELDTKPLKEILDTMSDAMVHGFETDPKPGQVWRMSKKLEGWDDAYRHVNTPFVLLLEPPSNSRVLVTQIYWDRSLISEADVDLGKTHGFSQPWNTSRIPVRSLSACWGEISQEALTETIRQYNISSETDYADSHPLIQSFHEYEKMVLSTMFSRAEAAEASLSDLARYIAQKFSQRFRLSNIQTLDTGEILAHSSFTGEASAMAAASPEQVVAVVVKENREITDIVGETTIEITSMQASKDGFLIAGRLPADIPPPSQVRVWWSEPNKTRTEAAECNISECFFHAFFPAISAPDTSAGNPKILIYSS